MAGLELTTQILQVGVRGDKGIKFFCIYSYTVCIWAKCLLPITVLKPIMQKMSIDATIILSR